MPVQGVIEPGARHIIGPPAYGSLRHRFAGRQLQGGGGWTRRLGWAWARRRAPTTLAGAGPRPRRGGGCRLRAHGARVRLPRRGHRLVRRRVLAWRLSITLEAAFCVEALEEALARHGRPEIFNTDQGSQFTGEAFTGALTGNGIAISMDGKGAWRDNVFVERLWRSVKYEEVYLRAYDTVAEARASIGRYLSFYNTRRPHSSLDQRTPDQAYFTRLPQIAAA